MRTIEYQRIGHIGAAVHIHPHAILTACDQAIVRDGLAKQIQANAIDSSAFKFGSVEFQRAVATDTGATRSAFDKAIEYGGGCAFINADSAGNNQADAITVSERAVLYGKRTATHEDRCGLRGARGNLGATETYV
ncbi:hypothetical protein [Pseudomonas sp. CBZ-4]|uniref:hypothetical protein n=1 Tax=Pseudomonas sp. CBZ-4 TaxID=1163065 RepID=UPI0003763E2F|nr:hypothetical protein [Pseudomonas sp. CBZ-4]